MKNAVLLLLLVPFFGFSQTTIASWNNLGSTQVNAHLTTEALQSNGITVENNGWSGFRLTDLHNTVSTEINYSKYLQFKITPAAGYNAAISAFNFIYNSPSASGNGPLKVQIRYSTDASFTGNGTLLGSEQTLNVDRDVALSQNFPSNYILPAGTPLYIRVYMYGAPSLYYTDFYLRNTTYNASTNGPSITGSVTSVAPAVMTAVADNFDVNLNTTTTVNVLTNDSNVSGVSNLSITNPVHGTVIVNANRTVTYTPAADYAGTDSFTYTISNGSITSTATVALNVTAVAPTSALSGTYFIGTNGHFATITAAVNSLNTYGVAGPVKFLLKNGTYSAGETFPITINAIANASSANTVTFKPYNGVTTRILATHVNDYTGTPAVFYLNGADYVTIDGSNTANGTTRDLTIDNRDDINYLERSVVWVASNGTDGANNITVENCIIKQSVKNQGGKFCMGIYAGNNGIGTQNTMLVNAASANNANLTVLNNDFVNVKQGVYVNGGSIATTGVTVSKNDLGATTNSETIICPATFSNVDGFNYNNNLVNNLYRSTDDGSLLSAGIFISGASRNGFILNNTMRDLTRVVSTSTPGFAGISLFSTEVNANILVANNSILNVVSGSSGGVMENGFGIFVNSGGGYKIYHNTVALNTNANGGFSAALFVGASARNLDVRNNIFSNNQTNNATRRAAIIVANQVSNINSIFTNLDYNDYFSNDRLGYIGNVNDRMEWPGNGTQGSDGDNPDYTYTLQAWKGVTGKDAHSVNVNPGFVSASDLHININSDNTGIANGGTPLTAVTTDMDGQLRSVTTPDMGADEFGQSVINPSAGDSTGIFCDSATTWNGTAWSNGAPSANKDVIFNGDFTQNGGKFYACSVFVLAGKNVNFTGDSNAIVTHSVNIAETGSLTFESSSNLLQLTDDLNKGIVTIKRNSSKLKRLDYTMWSAPVTDKRTTGYQTLQSFSPATSANRFYEYSTVNNVYQTLPAETTKFTLGKGFLIRMPNADATTGYNEGQARLVYTGAFTGTPNNGTINVALDSSNAGYNAVGNPYPSPISVKAFINENLNNIDGTIWIWRKTNDHTTSSYSTINLAGYCANVARGGNNADGNDLVMDPYSIDPNGSLNTAQGFIVKAKANTSITYKNSMRLQTNSYTFFRTGAPESTEATTDRLWINVTNNAGEFSQSLIAYNPATTLGYDNGYDGKALMNGDLNLYTIAQTASEVLNLTIQSRGSFTVTDRIKLGYTAGVSGTFILSLDHSDGRFAQGQTVYIVDSVTGATHNLTNGAYTFTSEVGTFNDRFIVAYAQEALGTDIPVVQTKEVMVYKSGKQVKVEAPAAINTVTVYDMLGKTIFQKSNVDGTSFATSELNVAAQVIVVQVTLDNQQVISKKILMN